MKKSENQIILLDSIDTIHLKNNSVTTNKINDGAITSIKILNKAITSDKLEDNIITSRNLADEDFTFTKKIKADNIEIKNITLTDESPIKISSKSIIENLNSEFLNGIKNSTFEIENTIAQRNSSGDIKANKFISTERFNSPFLINSNSLVVNLNANFLNGYLPSNQKNNIPISNGNLNENLNSEFLNGASLSNNEFVSEDDKLIPTENIVKKSIENTFKSFEISDTKNWDFQTEPGVNIIISGKALNGPQKQGYFYVFNLINEENITQLAIPTNSRLFSGSFIRMKYNNIWSNWSNFSIGDPLQISYKTQNRVDISGHTHELSSDILNKFSEQEIIGKNLFHKIYTNQEIKDENQVTNKAYVDNKFLVNKNIVGFNYEYVNSSLLLIEAGECFDITLKEKITINNFTKTTFNDLLFKGVSFKEFSTFHIFAIKNKNGDCKIGIDNNINATNRPIDYIYYRRIGSLITNRFHVEPFVKRGNKILFYTPKIINIYNSYNGKIKMYCPEQLKTICLLDCNGNVNSLEDIAYKELITNQKAELFFNFETDGYIKVYGWKDYLVGE